MPESDRCDYNLSLLIFVIICTILTLGVTNALPAYDLSISSVFCNHTAPGPDDFRLSACAGFPAASSHLMQIIRKILFYIPPVVFATLLIEIVRTRFFRTMVDINVLQRQVLAAVAYLAGPILIVNMFLKAMSGRPRPYESLPFGGHLLFVPAGDFTGTCMSNCSFVSGEAAAAGWLLCLLPLVRGRYSRALSGGIVCISLLTPALRVVMGGHFISDVALGWLAGASAYPAVVVAVTVIRQASRRRIDRAT